MAGRQIPVILDTDIGGDIDDTWALAMLLKCPELKVRLVVSDTGDTDYRARICAKFLDKSGRTDIPVGVGVPQQSDGPREKQRDWIADYPLSAYPGRVYADGVQAIIDTIMNSPEPVTLIAIGPVPNIRAALELEPRIATRTHLVGMFGSINKHHVTNMNNRIIKDGPIAEWNVAMDVAAAQALFDAPWRSLTITPLDTCALIMFEGDRYRRLRDSSDPQIQMVIENYRMWSPRNDQSDPEAHSSVLYDTVAIYLAFTTRYLRMQRMKLRVDHKGFLVEDVGARPVEVAIAWEDLDAYYDFLEKCLTGPLA